MTRPSAGDGLAWRVLLAAALLVSWTRPARAQDDDGDDKAPVFTGDVFGDEQGQGGQGGQGEQDGQDEGDDAPVLTGEQAQDEGDDAPVFTGEQAQGEDDDAPVFTGEQAQGEGEAGPGPTDEGQAGSGEQQWELPRVLVVHAPRTPIRLTRAVLRLLEDAAEVIPGREFARKARARGYPPTSLEAFEELLPDMDVDLAVVVEATRVRGRPHVRLTYRQGQFGLVLLVEEHPLAGLRLTDEVEQRILGETRLALAVVTRPSGERAPAEGDGDAQGTEAPGSRPERARREPGAAVHVGLAAGFGVGTRAFDVPTEAGDVRLTTSPFPAASLHLGVDVEPQAQGRLSAGGELRYLTSVGLRTVDMRLDGTNRETASRSQRLDVGARLRWRVADALDAFSIDAQLAYGLRFFSSEAPVALPDFSLSGPLVRIGFRLPLFDGRLAIRLAPEVQWIVAVGEALEREGVRSQAFAVGGEASARLRITGPFFLQASYRESHALLSSPLGDAGDVERYAVLTAIYRP